jgi:hypothetical protein
VENEEEVALDFEDYIPKDVTKYNWAKNPFCIAIENLADDFPALLAFSSSLSR